MSVRTSVGFAVVGLALSTPAAGTSLTISLGVRETAQAVIDGGGTPDPLDVGSDGGTAGGIEWIDLDGQTLELNGQLQGLTWDLEAGVTQTTAFAGSTANGLLEGPYGTIEHIRILNSDGETLPIRLGYWNVNFTPPNGPALDVFFEPFDDGDQVLFREPGFSGSTETNLLPGSTSSVQRPVPGELKQYVSEFQFVDNDPTRWVRHTTFNTDMLGNPEIGFNGRVTLTLQGVAVPEPGFLTGALLAGALGLLRRR